MQLSRSQFEPLPNIRKIAVLRANALGDFIFILPALDALHTTYPQAEIVLLAKAWHKSFLEDRPGPVDRVIVIPPSEGVSELPGFQEDPIELERFFYHMRQEHFDLAIQLHGGGRYSNPFLLRLDATYTIGLKTPDAAPLDRWVPYVYFQQEILRYLEIVSLVGASPVTLEPRIAVTEQDRAEIQQIIAPASLQPLVVLHPGATDPRRRWPPEKFAEVGDTLAARGASVVITGTGSEQEDVSAVVQSMQHPCLNLCNRLSLGGLTALLQHSKLVVSNDSGPLHLASAVGTPTVGIYWCFNLINSGPLTRMYHRPHSSWRLNCPLCGRNASYDRCTHQVSFVADVSTEEVIASALDLFYRQAQ